MQVPETEYDPTGNYEQYKQPEVQPVNNRPATNTSTEQTQKEPKKETIQVPTSLVRWFCYSVFFSVLMCPLGTLMPLTLFWKIMCVCCIGMILGHFAGQLNKLIDK